MINKKTIFSLLAVGLAGLAFFSYKQFAPSAEIKSSESTPSGARRIADYEYNFSLEYPLELVPSEFDEADGGKTYLFKKPGEKIGFQLTITPYSGSSNLTAETIRQDLPGMVIEDPVQVVVGEQAKDPVKALVFWSQDANLGRVRELWIAKGGFLYAVITYPELDAWLARIMSTFRTL